MYLAANVCSPRKSQNNNNKNNNNNNNNNNEVARSHTVEHLENKIADTNMQENEETTPINDPLPEEEKALRDRLKIKLEEAALIEFGQSRRSKGHLKVP